MKKTIRILLTLVMLLSLCACGQQAAPQPGAQEETEAQENVKWTREGYFTNDNEDMVSVTWMEDVDEPGWYVGAMIGEIMTGGFVREEGGRLHGDLNAWDESAEPFVVTVSEEGEDGLLVEVEGGETLHFVPMEMPEATIFVTINTEGLGNIAYEVGEQTPEIDPEYPFQSAQINLAEPAVYTILAWPSAGSLFVKWTKNGEDFTAEPQFTVSLDESADYVAVFEEDPDWQNPFMNYVGSYRCDRAVATVECFGADEGLISIEWGGSASEAANWIIFCRLDGESPTISYTDCQKSIVIYDENGEIKSEETEYVGGTGTISFRDDGSFVWHEDEAADREDMVFEWVSASDEGEFGLANPWRELAEEEAKALCMPSFSAPEGAENVRWSVMDGEPPLVELSFDLNGLHFLAREQLAEGETDLSGLYYDWTDEREEALKNWPGELTAKVCRFLGEGESADLCSWYDPASGVAYSLGVVAEDLDGFDLLAIAEQLYR